MSEWTPTWRIPARTWVGLGDDRRYLLVYGHNGWLWPWFRTDDGWMHAADPVWPDSGMHTTHGPATSEETESLRSHVLRIPTEGCGVRGWCRYHPQPQGH